MHVQLSGSSIRKIFSGLSIVCSLIFVLTIAIWEFSKSDSFFTQLIADISEAAINNNEESIDWIITSKLLAIRISIYTLLFFTFSIISQLALKLFISNDKKQKK
ncbi:MAG: hypothetical protein AAF380_01830 [Bacteroidota bacterium]